MRKPLQWLLAAVVAAACAAQPIAIDACHAACDIARSARVAADPPCHHAAAGPRIGQTTVPCGQDHAVVPGNSGAAGPAHVVALSAPATSPLLFDAVAPRAAVVNSSSDPPVDSFSFASNTPLRV